VNLVVDVTPMLRSAG